MLACKPQQHRFRINRFKSLRSDVRNPRWTLTFLQVILETSWWSAPHVPHKSGSHSRTAKKQGHCLVLHWALHRQPGNRFWPDREIYLVIKPLIDNRDLYTYSQNCTDRISHKNFAH
jgi:hypothetical protein